MTEAGVEEDGVMTKVAALLKASQDNEKQLYARLKTEADNLAGGKPPTMSEEERDELVNEINYESEKRQNYYELVKTARGAQSAAENMATKAAAQQILTMQYLESNLDASKAALNAVAEDRQKKMRMVEINTYFGKQFGGYAAVGRAVAIVCVVLLVVVYLRKRFEKVAPALGMVETAVKWLGGLYILYNLLDLVLRRNDNYDEYIFPMAPVTAEQVETANSIGENIIDISGIDIPGLCAGSYCCGPGTSWSDSSGCVIDVNLTA